MNINEIVRPNIKKLIPYSSARGEKNCGILLDANENPYQVLALEGIGEELNRYPDPRQLDVRKKLGEAIGINYEKIFCGVGSDEIIDLLIRIFCIPGKDNAVIPEPTYGMYSVACSVNDIEARSVLLNEQMQIDVEKTLSAADEMSKIIFLCSPNNPTGNLLDKDGIRELCCRFNGIVVVDEAYIDFAPDGTSAGETDEFNNLIVLRTFSKAWGLAGIRFGYCIAGSEIIELLFKIKAPYTLNRLTSSAVLEVLKRKEEACRIIPAIISERDKLAEKLMELDGIEKVFKSDSNYILFKCSAPADIRKSLLDKGITIRDRSSQPMLEGCLRVSVGTPEENSIFITALRRALCEKQK